MEVRALAFGDVEQVLGINSTAIPAVAALDRKELTRLMTLSGIHLVVDDGHAVQGYALAFRERDDYEGEEFVAFRSRLRRPFVYVDQVAVRPKARGTGIGRRLYKALEHAGLVAGAGFMCCEVNIRPPNPDSSAFHRRLGFTVEGTISTRDGRDVELLKREIARTA